MIPGEWTESASRALAAIKHDSRPGQPRELFWALVDQESRASEILAAGGLDPQILEQRLPRPAPSDDPTPNGLDVVLREAAGLAGLAGRVGEVGTEHLLFGLAQVDETIAEAKERGFVTTLLGRRRYLPDLASRNRVLRQAAERMAVNTVIQGTEADLIKKAMVEIGAALRGQASRARLLLQVHDELVFETPRDDIDALCALATKLMRGAPGDLLSVPLEVEVGVGDNWREAH